MELFKRFDTTIFYKKNSELEYQIEALKKLNSEFPNNEKLKQKLKLCELGLKGEKEIEFELTNSNIGMYVLHDVNLQYEDLKAQIDYIIITPGYIYFIECKNLIGNITVNNRGEFIREYSYNGKKVKEGIYSPIRQSERHAEIFKKIWKQNHTGIINQIKSNKIDNWLKPLVVMANPKNILNVKYAPKDIKEKIIRSDSLVNYIKDDIKKFDKDLLNNEKQMKENAFNLMNNYNVMIERDYEEEYRKTFINQNSPNEKAKSLNGKSNARISNAVNSNKSNNVSSNVNKNVNSNVSINEIRAKLIEYRKVTSRARNVPAYYVFNNDELEKILQRMPKSIQELRDSKILTNIKLKIYGEDIIKLINKM